MKIAVLTLVMFLALFGEEIPTKKTEGGLIHTKQAGRYSVVFKLPEEVDGFDQAFDYAKPFGTFRLANVKTQQDALEAYNIDEEKTSGTSFGGIFGLESASLYGLNLHLGAYVSQKITSLNPSDSAEQNMELFDANGDSFVYVGEASLQYENEMTLVKAGRIRVETPFAGSDDIRMVPNSFEGAWGKVKLGNRWRAQAYYLTRWAGTDSGDDQEVFKPLVDEDGYGLAGAALSYKINNANKVSLWYYNIDKQSDIVYAEGTGELYFSEAFHMEWGLQGAHISERDSSGIEGDVLGAMAIADYDFVYLGLAYNHVFEEAGKTITDGFGGGPYYTSLDEQTIGAVSALSPGDDLMVYRVALGFDFTTLGIDQLNLEFIHGHFLLEDSPAKAKESDVVLTYAITDRWSFESIYSDINMMNIDYSNPDNRESRDFRRLVTRLDYSF